MRLSRRSRRLALGWASPIGIFLALLLITWLAGGFRPASTASGPTAELGERLELRRWAVQLRGPVELTDTIDGSETDPAFRIRATVELTSDTSVALFPDLVTVRVPSGPATDNRRSGDWNQSEGFDPDLPRDQVWDFPWAGGEPPHSVQIIVKDERPSQGYVFADEWTTGQPAGVITTPVVDARQQHGR